MARHRAHFETLNEADNMIEQKEYDAMVDFIEVNLLSIDPEEWFDLVKKEFPNMPDVEITETIMILSGGDCIGID